MREFPRYPRYLRYKKGGPFRPEISTQTLDQVNHGDQKLSHLSGSLTSLIQDSELNAWQSGVEIPGGRKMEKVEEKEGGKIRCFFFFLFFLRKERAI